MTPLCPQSSGRSPTTGTATPWARSRPSSSTTSPSGPRGWRHRRSAASADDVPVIVPICDAEYADGRLRLTVPADAVRTAPRVAQADRLSPEEEATLRSTTARRRPPRHDRHHGDPPPGDDDRHGSEPGPSTPGRDRHRRPHRDRAPHAGDRGRHCHDPHRGAAPDTTVVEPWTRAVLRIEEVTEEVWSRSPSPASRPASTTCRCRHHRRARTPGEPRRTGRRARHEHQRVGDALQRAAHRHPGAGARRAGPVAPPSGSTEETAFSEELRREQIELTPPRRRRADRPTRPPRPGAARAGWGHGRHDP